MPEDTYTVESFKETTRSLDQVQTNFSRHTIPPEKRLENDESKGGTQNKCQVRGSRFSRGNDRKKNKGYGAKYPTGSQKNGEIGNERPTREKSESLKRDEDSKSAKRRKVCKESGDLDQVEQFSREEIESEQRRPKRKVAVMIGYAGTGYKGMQINNEEKTIEGDIFKAFVAAGAISKANADDPKKSSLVRCARTDKGVHAAGNVISLKLIVEDSDIVQKINDNLPPQIRVWGYERTSGGFSCYQSCDSRWYEYLIPTYSFLPPHPQSFLGKKLVEFARREGQLDAYLELQEDVSLFWENALQTYVKPILDNLDPELAASAILAVHKEVNDAGANDIFEKEKVMVSHGQKSTEKIFKSELQSESNPSVAESKILTEDKGVLDQSVENIVDGPEAGDDGIIDSGEACSHVNPSPLELAIREIKAAYITAKKSYRISTKRQKRIQEALDNYIGTHNFHNYTVQKKYTDPSAKRVIRSFDVGSKPIIINDTEWLSLKVHGQSFMMHQIRKMVGMVALVVRCATPLKRIQESYGKARISIPKAPGLGLLLERPVFSSYNNRAVAELQREKIDFDKYKTVIDEFKQREIYDRIFREEERDHQFHSFFHHLDHFRSEYFLWVTAGGISIARTGPAKIEIKKAVEESEDEVDINGEEG
ncbi:tRNA pseudouridine synthase 1 [Golovinomyces cichoracearum]|uniref:tRNA pseudouridine synthase 1 n=1 Tax=Golovinomyces cichoracearum TaxID=62708 RepID=A0A420J667_9PEZI|nr:tRNA pseudouridine synthase 1 [Golovinomyces cichoracearum]